MKKIFTFLLLFATGLNGFGQKTESNNSLLWEISGNGLKKKSYLLGTIHIIPESEYKFPKYYTKAIKKCDNMVMEIDLTDIMGQLKVAKLALMKDSTLEDLFSKDDYDFIVKTLRDSFNMSMSLYGKMKPIFVQQQLSVEAFKGGGMKSYEMELMSLGLEYDMTFKGLETAEEQMSILDSIPLRDQATMLLESLKNINDERVKLRRLINFYAESNLDSLTAIFEAEDNDLDEHETSLLDNRNKKWIPLIEEMIKEAPSFIAVGAGHLGGEFGVINLLRNQGYTLKPIFK